MVARVMTVAFDGVEARRVDVEVQLVGGDGPTVFNIVGLPDKAVAESRERVRGPSPASAWPCRPAASSPTWRRPTCPRRAVISTCPSPWP